MNPGSTTHVSTSHKASMGAVKRAVSGSGDQASWTKLSSSKHPFWDGRKQTSTRQQFCRGHHSFNHTKVDPLTPMEAQGGLLSRQAGHLPASWVIQLCQHQKLDSTTTKIHLTTIPSSNSVPPLTKTKGRHPHGLWIM